MKKLFLFILFIPGLVYSQTKTVKNARSADTLQELLINTDASGISRFALVTGSDTTFLEKSGSSFVIRNREATGNASILIDPEPVAGSGNAFIDLFTTTNTSGTKQLRLASGDGSANYEIQFAPDAGDSFFNAGGKLGINTSTPDSVLHVDGGVKIEGDAYHVGDYELTGYFESDEILANGPVDFQDIIKKSGSDAAITSNANITSDYWNIFDDSGGTAITGTLPTHASYIGTEYMVINRGTSNLTIAVQSGDYLNEVLNGTATVSANQMVIIYATEINTFGWFVSVSR